jgi:predicted metal-dependent phosphoesterase TrpH
MNNTPTSNGHLPTPKEIGSASSFERLPFGVGNWNLGVDTPLSRADLHVHSRHSRVCGSLRFLRSRDCYSSPLDVYLVAKRRGMDVVTITDHDAIDGWRELMDARPDAADILAGEEVSCWLPDADVQVHLGVYGITERLHAEIQPLRRNVFDVMARLRESGTFFALNHLLHGYRGQAPLESYLRLVQAVPALETRNGAMLEAHNALLERLCRERSLSLREGTNDAPPMACVAGSDAHTLRRVGRTWTEAPGTTAAAFLASLAAGLGRPGGRHGGAAAVAGDTYGVIGRYMASVYGWGPRDHAGWHRATCACLIAALVPVQFLPAVVAALGKSRERRAVAAAIAQLAARPRTSASWPAAAAEPLP